MSARIVRYLLERITSIDLNLMTRFARRERDRLVSSLRQKRHMHGPVGNTVGLNREQDLTTSALAGLEVEYVSGSQVQVTAGSMLVFNPSPAVETRPLTWSGRVEADDYANALFVLPANRTVAPPVPISGTLASPEWWVIYIRPSEVAVETDSQRRVFNEGTGVFDVASATKVTQYQATPGVVRGAPGSGIPSVTGAYDVPIAWIYVPNGAGDLSGATIYDVRKLHEELGLPNMVGGQWQCPLLGQMTDAYSGAVWRGSVWARIGGERLFAATSSGLSITQLAEPGASWDGTASLSAPKTAWLYLARPKGAVPRPRRQGSAVIGSSGRNDRTILEGGLVLSPTPPKIGVRATNNPDAALRWDLRPSAPLTLPNNLSGSVPYPFGNILVQPDDALCVGFMRYTAVDSLGHPRVYGNMKVTSYGWCSGEALSIIPSADFGSFSTGVILSEFTVSLTQGTVNVGGTNYLLPFVAWRAASIMSNASVPLSVQWRGENAGDAQWIVDCGGGNNLATRVLTMTAATPGESTVDFASGSVAVGTPSSLTLAVGLHSVRFPYGEPLVT